MFVVTKKLKKYTVESAVKESKTIIVRKGPIYGKKIEIKFENHVDKIFNYEKEKFENPVGTMISIYYDHFSMVGDRICRFVEELVAFDIIETFPDQGPSVYKTKGKIGKTKVILEITYEGLIIIPKKETKGGERENQLIKFEDIVKMELKRGLVSETIKIIQNEYQEIKIKNVPRLYNQGGYFVEEFQKIQKQVLFHNMTTNNKSLEEEALKNQLKTNDNFRYIENFANRFINNYTVQDFNLLKELLSDKGIKCTERALRNVIDDEIKKQIYIDFKTKITYNNPKTLKEYVCNLMELYGANYGKYIYLLKQFLTEIQFIDHEINYDDTISMLENQIEKEKKLVQFEEELISTIDSGKSPFISINDIDQLNGYEFEGLLKVLFQKMGYDVVNTPLSGDQGADLILNKFSEKIVVQAKRYKEKVSNKAVQEATASIAHYNADRGIVVTNSEFTQSAIELANSNNIELINRNKLENLINQHHIRRKQRI